MTYDEWVAQVPKSIKQDPLWQFEVYPKALLLADFAWEDCGKLMRDVRGRKIAEQLIDSAGSVSANIEEGFGRGYGRDYARFLSIALCSARESRGWYYRGRKLLTTKILEYRYQLLKEIIALLVTHIKKQKALAKKQKTSKKTQAASA
jgi:four helix bundle protein